MFLIAKIYILLWDTFENDNKKNIKFYFVYLSSDLTIDSLSNFNYSV